jgi:voltage-gated potassium channel
MFRRRAVHRQIGELRGHYIICGFGRVGEAVAREFAASHAAFVVIDSDPATVARVSESGYLSVEGDASQDETLLEAGVERAAGLVAAVDSDADTIYVVLSARVLNPQLTIVARAASEESAGKVRRAGADQVISPYSIGGKKMATLMLKPLVSDYLEVVSRGGEIEFRLEEFALNGTCEVAGRSIRDLDIRRATGATVLAVRRGASGQLETNPGPDLVLEETDVLIAIGTPADIGKLEELFACHIPSSTGGV